jgi:hypothetical protein
MCARFVLVILCLYVEGDHKSACQHIWSVDEHTLTGHSLCTVAALGDLPADLLSISAAFVRYLVNILFITDYASPQRSAAAQRE